MKNVFACVLLLLSIRSQGQTTPDISLVFFLKENTVTGTLVGAVSATDPDGDELTYAITSGDEGGAFSIASTGNMAGTITVATGELLDFEITPVFDLMVEANDGNGGVTTASVTVNLIDIDEDALSVIKELGIEIYPNPMADFLSLDLGSAKTRDSRIKLFDARGNQVIDELNQVGKRQMKWDTGSLADGIYIMKIELQDRDPISVRLVKKN